MISGIIRGFIWFYILLFKWVFYLLRWVLKNAWEFFRGESKTFGSARWAKVQEVKAALCGDGLIIGKIGNKFLRYNDKEAMVIVFAPSRSGKGVGVVIPNLLDYQGSIICTDPKGENYAITKRQRKKFGEVFCLNMEHPETSSCFNPLDSIRIGTFYETDDAILLAGLMIKPDKNSEAHWRDKAVAWLAAFILYVLHKYTSTPELQTLTQVRALTKSLPASFQAILQDMAIMPQSGVYESANEMLAMGDSREAMSILSTLEKGTRPFSIDRPIAAISSRSDFSFNDLNANIKSIFIVIPEDNLEHYLPYMRVLTGLAISGVMREGKKGVFVEHPPLFMLDEVAALGYLKPLETGIGYLRTYAKLILVFQDVDQLEKTYSKANSIISNAGCQIYFGVNEIKTAKDISERIGNKTVRSRSDGLSQANDAILSHQQSAGKSEAARALIDPSEITRLPDDDIIIFMKKVCNNPIKVKAVKYYNEHCFRGLHDKWRN